MPQGPRPPAYVIPTTEIGVVIYQDREAVGIQFVDPAGEQVLVTIPGSALAALGQSIQDLTVKMPAVLHWKAGGRRLG